LKKTLLLADDSPTIQKVINLTFADEGIDVIAVGDGNAAIQQLRELKPDLVMADVHMPGLNGYQICERIRQNVELSKVPVILLVGSFEPFDEEEARRVGADDFLMKPFQSIRQLVSRVAALLDPVAEPAVEAAAPEELEGDLAEETRRDIEPVSDMAVPAGAPAAASLTPEDVFQSPWTEQPAAVAVTPETPPEEIVEKDDLSDFDSEFDQKFPDAASLSSEFVDTAKFDLREEPAGVLTENVEHADTARIQPEPEEEQGSFTQAQAPERVLDEPEKEEKEEKEEEEEQQTLVISEASSILDLGDFGASTNQGEEDPVLELNTSEPAAVAAVDTPAPVSETVEPAATATKAAAEPQLYDFREADAFDDDSDIRESFHGLRSVEEKPAVSFQAPLNQAPLERVLDVEPSNISEDQADGFSGVSEVSSAPRQISPESIEAIAQRVFEKLSEKVVRELAREVVPEMKDLIARELAKENGENE